MPSTDHPPHPFSAVLSVCDLYYQAACRLESEVDLRRFFDDMDGIWGLLSSKKIDCLILSHWLTDIIGRLHLNPEESVGAKSLITSLQEFDEYEDRDELPPAFSIAKRRQTLHSLLYLNVFLRTESFERLGIARNRGNCRAMSALLQHIQVHGWMGEAFEAELEKLVIRLNCDIARINYHRPHLPWD